MSSSMTINLTIMISKIREKLLYSPKFGVIKFNEKETCEDVNNRSRSKQEGNKIIVCFSI